MTDSTLAEIWASLGIPADYAEARRLALEIEADAGSLVVIGRHPDRREIRLTAPAAAAWENLRQAAVNDLIELLPISGFRSVARQAEIIRAKLATGQPLAEILRFVAAPGCSEHHTGCALDLATPGSPPLEEVFAHTPAFAWLTRRARDFGFTLSYPVGNAHGIGYEPWHWRWRPPT